MNRHLKNQRELAFRILSTDELSNLLNPDSADCPFHSYVGNRAAVDEMLDLAYDAFQQRQWYSALKQDLCPRICAKRIRLQGPPSVGKTTLAKMFAKTLKLPFIETEPGLVKTKEDLFELLEKAYEAKDIPLIPEEEEGGIEYYFLPAGVLFIDEIHLMSDDVQDGFLKMTEPKDAKLILSDKVIDTKNLCIIIATTDIGELRDAFRSRFTEINLYSYNKSEVAKIINFNYPDWDIDDCLKIAAVQKLPRQALDFVDSVNKAMARQGCNRDEAIDLVIKRRGIINGMSLLAVSTLKILNSSSGGLSRKSLCSGLKITEKQFECECIPYLLADESHGAYMEITNRHMITDEGKAFLKSLA